MDFISFDLETTGTLSHIDQILEIAAIKFQNGQPVDTYTSLVSIEAPIPKEAAAVHGITDEMIKGKPPIKEVLPHFTHFCGDHVMVAHNAIFDFQFLSRALAEEQLAAPRGIVLDTCNLSRKTFTGLVNYKLSTLCKYLKISSKDFHRAEADAISCGYLFVHILKTLACSDIKQIIKFSEKTPLVFPRSFRGGQLSLF